MPRYLLDSNPVIVFQRAGQLPTLITAAGSVPMAMVDDVHAELTIPKPGKPLTPEMRQASQALSCASIAVIQIDVGSPEDDDRTALRLHNNAGPGEAGSVAVAMRQSELIFVTEDVRAAAGRAKLYRELPGDTGRILGLHAFLRVLVERQALAASTAEMVAIAGKAWSNLDAPRWWQPWLDACR